MARRGIIYSLLAVCLSCAIGAAFLPLFVVLTIWLSSSCPFTVLILVFVFSVHVFDLIASFALAPQLLVPFHLSVLFQHYAPGSVLDRVVWMSMFAIVPI